MPAFDIPFPCAGSRAFERSSGRALTVLQHRADGRVLVSRDDVRGAFGNATLELDDLVETSAEAGEGYATIAGKPRHSRRARRACAPGARS